MIAGDSLQTKEIIDFLVLVFLQLIEQIALLIQV